MSLPCTPYNAGSVPSMLMVDRRPNDIDVKDRTTLVADDVHLRRFVEQTLGRRISEDDIVEVVCAAARELGMRSYELDWSIWEYQRASAS